MNLRSPLILASSSPRRKFLLAEAGFNFTVASPDVDESFSSELKPENVPAMLAEKKANVLAITNEIVIASDTVVILQDTILNKPSDRADAIRMLSLLSGKTHRVVTAISIRTRVSTETFSDVTAVTFRSLSPEDIESYVDEFQPLDKAGSYGAQDCLPPGFNPCSTEEILFLKKIEREDLLSKTISPGNRIVIIDKIDGSYFTVMGFPIHLVFEALKKFQQ